MDSNKKIALTDEEIDDILHKDIIDLLGITELSEKEKEDFRQTAIKTIENRAYGKVLKLIEEKDKLESYKKVEDVDKFLEEIGINLDLLFVEAALAYKLEMKSFNKVIDNTLLASQKANGGD